MRLREDLKKNYPFKSHFLELEENIKLHYIKEGKGEKTVLVHGNPSWSYLFRHLVKDLKTQNFEAISLDHIGCGLSSKPQDYPYRLKQHIKNFSALMDKLEAEKINLIVHDWGGAIALGWAVKNPDKVKRLVITNTAAYLSQNIPWQIALCKEPLLNSFIIRRLNGFALPATFMATAKGLSKEAKQGLLFPYDNYKNRVAISNFVEDIPLEGNHPSYKTLSEIEKKLPLLKCPKLILWGMKDFCFNQSFLNKWKDIYKDAKIEELKQAGHYLFEDEKELVSQKILNFLKN